MQELERVLDSLLHDVRGPLGVVGGYLRLLRDGKASDPAQAERAIGKAQDALRSVADLCADASGWLPRSHPLPPVEVRVTDFLDAVAAAADGLWLERVSADGDRRLRLGLPMDRVAAAVVALMRLAPRGDDRTVRALVDDGRLRIGPGAETGAGAAESFDPWQHPGLAVPLARFVVVSAGGTCLAHAADPRWPSIEFPLAV